MSVRTAVLAGSIVPALALASGLAYAYLAEFGIEGMGVVSTPATEGRATVSPDGQRIVWGSTDRAGGAGGADLWEARLVQGRWQEARPLAINSAADDADPAFSANGRWLYFSSDRPGGLGGRDLYRAAVREDGSFGAVENLGPGVNGQGHDAAPAPDLDGRALLFASDARGGAEGWDLYAARWEGSAFAGRRPVAGVNTRADEIDAVWLEGGKAIVFTRSEDAQARPTQVLVAPCDGRRYGPATPLALSFNTPDGATRGPARDWNKPAELLLTGTAKAPRAGKLDIYRTKVPTVTGSPGCL